MKLWLQSLFYPYIQQSLYYQTEAWAGEYDVPKADPATPPEETVHEITARWKVSDMINQCDTRKGGGCSGNITGKIF